MWQLLTCFVQGSRTRDTKKEADALVAGGSEYVPSSTSQLIQSLISALECRFVPDVSSSDNVLAQT